MAHNNLQVAEIMTIEAISDVEVLTERNKSVTDLLKDKESQLEQAIQETNTFRERAAALITVCKEHLDSGNEERDAFLRALPEGQTMEELDNEIESEKARLELMHEGNGSVLREFEKRRQQIDKLMDRLTSLRTAKTELDGVVEVLQNQWEPKLDALVRKISASFSYNMEHISCAGEVGIKKDDDFDQWAIEIRVKFRFVTSHFHPLYPLSFLPPSFLTDILNQRNRTPHTPRLPPTIRRRARRLHNLLPHVPPIPHSLPLPRRRRNQPRHGSPQ